MLTTQRHRLLPPDQRKVRNSSARAAGSFVPKLTAKVFEKYGFHSAEIMTAWAAVAGADIAAISAPDRLKWPRGAATHTRDPSEALQHGVATLVLRVEPAHALDVEYRAAEIIDRINRYFGYRAVATLKIIQAPALRSEAARPIQLQTFADQTLAIPPLDMPMIADGALKDALAGLWSSVSTERARR